MSSPETHDAISSELVAESALSLGRAGGRLEAALAALAAYAPGAAVTRALLVDAAAYHAWSYVVLRGALGWSDDDAALRAYDVPAEVRARIGAVRDEPTPPA